MSTYLGYLLAGIGGGAVIGSLALGLVLSYRSSGVVNFAHAAMGLYVASAFFEFRATGDLVLPVLGLPDRIHLLARPTLASSLAVAIMLAAALGATVYALVFRPLRHSPALARVVASLGLLIYLQEMVRLRFPVAGAAVQHRRPVLPDDPMRVLGTTITQNRLLLAGLTIAVTVALGALYRFTRFGLATRAAADNEKGALLLGIAPDRLGVVNWSIASILAGLAVILIEPIAGLHPSSTTLLVLPALAAALAGGLKSFAVTTAAGFGIGMTQSLILGYAVGAGASWIPGWIPTIGLQQIVPVVVILGVLMLRNDALPDRSAVLGTRLPVAPWPRHVGWWATVLAGSTVAALLVVDAPMRQAVIVSLIASLVALSIVVVTGYSGQISLAQLALAGIAGFTVIRLGDRGVPLVPAVVLATAIATAVGVAIAYPATRVRGMTLAIATLAVAVALEELVLASTAVSGGLGGASVPRPSLFGIDLGVSATGPDNFRPAFGIAVLVVLTLSCIGVANLRRNQTGMRWLAVRANERAAAAAGIDVAATKLGAFAVSSCLAGLAGVLAAYSTTTLSRSSFLVIGALVALALTYLAGISSIAGALVAGAITQGGVVMTWLGSGGDTTDRPTFAISGVALIVTAIAAPGGLTGVLRGRIRRVVRA